MSDGRKRGRKWLVTGAVGLAGVAILAGAGLATRGPPPAVPAASEGEGVAVTVEALTPRAVRRSVSVVGSLYGRDEIVITTKVDARVLKVHRDVMDVVRPGQALLDLDPTDYKLAEAEARTALELELAKLGLKAPPDASFDVASLPSVARAVAMERNAGLRVARARRLVGAMSPEDRDAAEKDYSVAQAESRQAQLDARATLASARNRRAAFDTVLQKLKDTKVVVPGDANARSPLEYAVCQRDVSEGEMVRAVAGTALFKLIVVHPLKLRAMVPERHRAEVKVGQEVRLEVEPFPGKTFPGTVVRVNPAVDRASRTFQVEAHVPNADRQLSPGSFAKAAILTRLDAKAPTVPEESILRFAGVTKVFVVCDGKAREVKVRTGVTVNVPTPGGAARTWVEVEGDFPPGAQVVTSGQTKLAEGASVRVRQK